VKNSNNTSCCYKKYVRHIFIVLLVIGFTNSFFSQTTKNLYKSTLPNNLNWMNIQTEFYKLLNELRQQQNATILYSDNILSLAATDQAHYMDSVHKVTHDQKLKRKETPQKRVFFYNGTHDQIGENCIMIYINKSMKVKYSKTPIVAKTENEIAKALFLGWKNSPGHYKNMITPDYDVAGLGFYFNKDSSILYSAQVFGAKPFVPKKGLDSPENAFDVKDYNPSICNCMSSNSWRELNNEMTIVQGEDSIYVECKKLDKFKAFFNNPTDAFYLDYVLREQFPCEKNNLLHGSPIYDGFMTKPVLCKDIIKRNKAPGNNLYAAIGPVPKEVKNYKYGLNYGIVKNGYGCLYTYVTTAPSENLAILNLIPKWIDNQGLEIKKDTFNGVLTFIVPFERGKTVANEIYKNTLIKRLNVYKPFAKSLKIKTFSSIEGSTDINLKLQKERAAHLKEIITSICNTELNTEIEAKENWEQFIKEIKGTRYNYLAGYSKEKIKATLQSKKMLDSLDIILKATRIAKIEIDITANIDKDSDPYILLGAYKKALEIGDSLQAFACQSRLIYYLRTYKLTNNDITSIEIPSNRKYISHLTNWVGLATNDPEMFYTNKTREMAVTYSTIDTNYLPLQFNYCIMAIKYIHELGDTIIPIKNLEYKINKCYKLKTILDSTYVDYMLLNYNILTAYNNYVIHRYEKIDKPLKDIKAYFLKHEINETEGIKLGLLFNLYGKYDWTLEILYPLLKKHPQNNDILFLFIKTYTPANATFVNEQEYLGYLTLAKKRDKKRFNDWVDVDCFQLMRRPEIKAEYCKP
jgi:uncharacterized protein YkwD